MLLLSTFHQTDVVCDSGKPEIIEFYNSTKGGVDNLDKLCVTYTCGRGTRRWPLCLFYCILDIAGVNSHVIFRHYNPNDNRAQHRRHFIKDLGIDLIRKHMSKRLEIKQLSKGLRTTIERVLNSTESQIQSNQDSICSKPKIKRINNTRCDICLDNELVTSATIRCEGCNRLVCKKQHLVNYCTECKNDDYLMNEIVIKFEKYLYFKSCLNQKFLINSIQFN